MARHFLKDDDITPVEQAEILELAKRIKSNRFELKPFAGPKTVAVIFDKTSTRTRVSFAVGIADLGGVPLIMDSGVSQLGKKESVADTARVLDRMVAQIVWRTYAQTGLEEMAQHSNVPVINALSDSWHPCQLLADLLTIQEKLGSTAGKKIAYVGDAANNMANSYLVACAMAGMSVSIASPQGYEPQAQVVARAREIAAFSGAVVEITNNPVEAANNADVVATDTWISMGMESEAERRKQAFAGFTVDADLLAKAKPSAIFFHCLPAYRGYEVSAEVLDGPQSAVWDQAENRLHAQKALMAWLANQN
jgi:ornithine carbamoyltransferase